MTACKLTLTDNAIQHIQSMIDKRAHAVGFRLDVKQTGCSGYMYLPEIIDAVQEGDIELNIAPFRVFIASRALDKVQGTQIDYVQRHLGLSQLVFNNPNSEGECGCGESFHLKEAEQTDE